MIATNNVYQRKGVIIALDSETQSSAEYEIRNKSLNQDYILKTHGHTDLDISHLLFFYFNAKIAQMETPSILNSSTNDCYSM